MTIQLTCSCGKRLRVPDNAAGKRAKCPACGKVGIVPSPVMAATVAGGAPAASAAPHHEEEDVMVRFWCGCGTYLQALSRYVGRDVRCPRCGSVRSIPAVDEDEGSNGHAHGLEARRLRFDAAHQRRPEPLDVAQEYAEEKPKRKRRSAWPWVIALLLLLLLGGGGFSAWYFWLR
jgi:predicted RNA-binding Zn-ribbon protein involved in translation (DUF1610 family)